MDSEIDKNKFENEIFKEKHFTAKNFKVHQLAGTPSHKETLTYNATQVVGSGSFGVVYQAKCVETNETVAIKKVFQDKRYKNRELQILLELDHTNVIKVKQYFYTPGNQPEEVFLNVVMEYIPDTLSKVIRSFHKVKLEMPQILVKLYSYQMIRSINYIHSIGICHRDIKPQNILVDPNSHILKLVDFGSAKKLVKTETNVAYICSRYYRAPELIFGSTEYSTNVDIWSIGCVIGELITCEPLFAGESSVDQLVEIIKILGTPNKKQIKEMNPEYDEYKFPAIRSFTWSHLLKNKNEVGRDFIDLLSKILVYEPNKRLKPLEALNHPFFDELREPHTKLPNGESLPDLIYQYTPEEYAKDDRNLIQNLIPLWYLDKTTKG